MLTHYANLSKQDVKALEIVKMRPTKLVTVLRSNCFTP